MKNKWYRNKNLLLRYLISIISISVFVYCDCTNNYESHDNNLPKFEGKSFQLLICSANVHGFKDPNAKDIFKELDKLKCDNDDIVIFGFQECYKNPNEVALPGYKVYANNCNDNAIFVYQKKDFGITQQAHTLQHFNTTRYVNLLTLSAANNLTIANTHLVGGRYDDKLWFNFPDGREKQLKQILTHKPEFILGDFNADTTDDIASVYWQGLLQKSVEPNKEANLKAYKTSGHQYLTLNNYTSTFNRDVVCPTTPFGTVVDWIYYLPAYNSSKVKTITILEQAKIEAINLNLSDHNFIWVRLQIELT